MACGGLIMSICECIQRSEFPKVSMRVTTGGGDDKAVRIAEQISRHQDSAHAGKNCRGREEFAPRLFAGCTRERLEPKERALLLCVPAAVHQSGARRRGDADSVLRRDRYPPGICQRLALFAPSREHWQSAARKSQILARATLLRGQRLPWAWRHDRFDWIEQKVSRGRWGGYS